MLLFRFPKCHAGLTGYTGYVGATGTHSSSLTLDLGIKSGKNAESTVTLGGTSDSSFLVPRKSLSALAFSPDGKYIVTGEVSLT